MSWQRRYRASASEVSFESPPPGVGANGDPPALEEPGTQIGPYKLLQVIGEGGEEFHVVALVEYPSRKAFAEIAQDPFVTDNIGKHRAAGLEMQWLIATTEAPAGG